MKQMIETNIEANHVYVYQPWASLPIAKRVFNEYSLPHLISKIFVLSLSLSVCKLRFTCRFEMPFSIMHTWMNEWKKWMNDSKKQQMNEWKKWMNEKNGWRREKMGEGAKKIKMDEVPPAHATKRWNQRTLINQSCDQSCDATNTHQWAPINHWHFDSPGAGTISSLLPRLRLTREERRHQPNPFFISSEVFI